MGTMKEIWIDAMAYRRGLGVMEGFGGTQSGRDYDKSKTWERDPVEECRKCIPRKMGRPGFTVLVHGGSWWTDLKAVQVDDEGGR